MSRNFSSFFVSTITWKEAICNFFWFGILHEKKLSSSFLPRTFFLTCGKLLRGSNFSSDYFSDSNDSLKERNVFITKSSLNTIRYLAHLESIYSGNLIESILLELYLICSKYSSKGIPTVSSLIWIGSSKMG